MVATCYTGVCSNHAFLLFFLLVFVLAEFLFYSQNVWYIPVRLVRRIPAVPAGTIWYRLPWFFFPIILLAWKIINISCKKSFPPIKVSKNLPWRWQAIVLLLFRRYCWITFSSWNSIFTHYLSSKKSSFSKMCHNGTRWSVIFNWKIHVEIKFMKLEFLI